MDKLNSKKALLDLIRQSEGVTFECDEKAILEEFKDQGENTSSIAIKILSIFGGFLATLAFLGFLVIAGLYNSELGLLTFGVLFIVSAILLNKIYNKLIIDTFSISIYVIGFVLLGLGLSELKVDENIIALFIGFIAFCSLLIAQNFMLSFISILTISGSFIFIIIENNILDLIHLYNTIYTLVLAYLILNEAKIISLNKRLSQLYNPLRIGLIFSLLFGLIAIGKKNLILISNNHIWLSSIVMILVVMYLVQKIIIINELKTAKTKTFIFSLSALILLSTIFSPSISGAIIIVLLCFLVNYKTGFTIGIISINYFVSQYYYDLNFTLLTKSIILFTSGIMFLLFYVFTNKKLNSDEKV